MSGEYQVVNGWRFPAGLDVPDERMYRIKYGGNEVWVLDWYGHMSLLHQVDVDSIDVEVVDSGVDDVRYAAAKATVVIDGRSYSAVGGADSASQQVREPEHVWSVAESRALKRAIKKALGIVPIKGDVPEHDKEETGDVSPLADHPAMNDPVEPEQAPEPKGRAKKAIETDEDLSW